MKNILITGGAGFIGSHVVKRFVNNYPNYNIYNIDNLTVVKKLLNIATKKIDLGKNVKIKFIKDRPGHDMRYAIDSTKIRKKLKWTPKIKFEDGLEKTFDWYLSNQKYYSKLKKKDIIKRLGTKKW